MQRIPDVFWLSTQGMSGGDSGVLNKAPRRGGATTALATGLAIPFALALDATYAYFCGGENDPMVGRVPKAGGPVETLATGGGVPSAIAVDATHVYWADPGVGAIFRVSLAGGPPEELASGQDVPVTIALDDTHVYWANQGQMNGDKGPLDGSILSLRKAP